MKQPKRESPILGAASLGLQLVGALAGTDAAGINTYLPKLLSRRTGLAAALAPHTQTIANARTLDGSPAQVCFLREPARPHHTGSIVKSALWAVHSRLSFIGSYSRSHLFITSRPRREGSVPLLSLGSAISRFRW